MIIFSKIAKKGLNRKNSQKFAIRPSYNFDNFPQKWMKTEISRNLV